MTDAQNETALEKIASEINAAHSVKGLPAAAKDDMQEAEAEVVALEAEDQPPVVVAPPAPTGPTPAIKLPWPASKLAFYEDWSKIDPTIWGSNFIGKTQNVSSSPVNISNGPNGLGLKLSSTGVGAEIDTRPVASAAKVGFTVSGEFVVESRVIGGVQKNWPGLWMVSVVNDATNREIDYYEGINGEITATLHWGQSSASQSPGLPLGKLTGDDTLDAYNTATEVSFYVNGVLIGTQEWGNAAGVDTEFYCIASIGCGSQSWNLPTEIPGLLTEAWRAVWVPA